MAKLTKETLIITGALAVACIFGLVVNCPSGVEGVEATKTPTPDNVFHVLSTPGPIPSPESILSFPGPPEQPIRGDSSCSTCCWVMVDTNGDDVPDTSIEVDSAGDGGYVCPSNQ